MNQHRPNRIFTILAAILACVLALPVFGSIPRSEISFPPRLCASAGECPDLSPQREDISRAEAQRRKEITLSLSLDFADSAEVRDPLHSPALQGGQAHSGSPAAAIQNGIVGSGETGLPGRRRHSSFTLRAPYEGPVLRVGGTGGHATVEAAMQAIFAARGAEPFTSPAVIRLDTAPATAILVRDTGSFSDRP